ncbi:protein of unknown function UPF0060 [Desulfofarcimen acetoxidans DSM 771]|uniref:Uncharacterized protein n=1 Tax=Desulfofarcimen acetoxidans (strain ATCC 49208 / DSM 771 / KCTC 5769 / VKM B-1644 / 5575) TaxID=485916 RepID=C8W0T0_DESAS|nr:YnfA family protein [Desulfofarcimen acetoxidans]ACV63335.1 protein of unknown function UPF0060 [Desulfofarcimen acetoxidans DSM 771]
MIFRSAVLFFLAGLAEIAGGYFVWIWLRYDASIMWGILGGIVLILYGVIPTLQVYPNFGRVYVAYGGIFIVLSLLWGWGIDKKRPDRYDWIGAMIALIGAIIIIWMPR